MTSITTATDLRPGDLAELLASSDRGGWGLGYVYTDHDAKGMEEARGLAGSLCLVVSAGALGVDGEPVALIIIPSRGPRWVESALLRRVPPAGRVTQRRRKSPGTAA